MALIDKATIREGSDNACRNVFDYQDVKEAVLELKRCIDTGKTITTPRIYVISKINEIFGGFE